MVFTIVNEIEFFCFWFFQGGLYAPRKMPGGDEKHACLPLGLDERLVVVV